MSIISASLVTKDRCPLAAKYFFMFMMVMWVARTTPLTSFKTDENPILASVYLLILAYFFLKYCKHAIKPLLVFLTVMIAWYISICIKYGSVQSTNFTFLYSTIIVHIAYNIFSRNDFIVLYEDVVVKLCMLSLVVWTGANLFPSVVPKIMHSIAVYENHPPTETNSFIVGMGSQFVMGIRRNIGFTWEPGRFSCFIIFAIFVNLIRTRFKILPLNKNKNFLILTITLLSTLSTTGYCAFGVIILFYIINVSAISKSFTILLTALIIPSVLGLSFMGDKMMVSLDLEQEINTVNYHARNGMEIVCPQRFSSLYFEYQNFIHDFWLGYNDIRQSYINNTLFQGVLVTSSQGLIEVFSKYGVFIGLFFYYWLFRSSIYMSKVYKYNGTYMFAVMFMVISVSYDFWENCIFMSFYLCEYYRSFSKLYFLKDNNSRL